LARLRSSLLTCPQEAGIAAKLWIEQPENIPTALATKPGRKSKLAPFFKKAQLCKWHDAKSS
jgi:hypothetical protein